MTSSAATKPATSYADATRAKSVFRYTQAAIVSLLSLALFGNVLVDMASDWWNLPALSQGMLIPPLALYIAWLGRVHIFSAPSKLTWSGTAVTSFACLVFLLGKLASEFFLMRIAFVLLLVGFSFTFWGRERTRRLAFPFLLLATMVPLPTIVYNTLAAPLQLLASDLATRIAQALGTSVFRDGNIIQLAGISLGVAEACSGLNSLSALLVGSLIIGYLFCSGLLSRTLLCIASVPVAIGMNILRVAGTAILADYNEAFAMGFYHSFSGWLVFLFGAAFLYLVARLCHKFLDRSTAA
jgi:exosortase